MKHLKEQTWQKHKNLNQKWNFQSNTCRYAIYSNELKFVKKRKTERKMCAIFVHRLTKCHKKHFFCHEIFLSVQSIDNKNKWASMKRATLCASILFPLDLFNFIFYRRSLMNRLAQQYHIDMELNWSRWHSILWFNDDFRWAFDPSGIFPLTIEFQMHGLKFQSKFQSILSTTVLLEMYVINFGLLWHRCYYVNHWLKIQCIM